VDRKTEPQFSSYEAGTLLERITPLARQINCLNLESIASVCIDHIPALVDTHFGSLYVLDEKSRILHLVKHNHPYPINTIVSLNQTPPTPMIIAVSTKEIIVIGDIDTHRTPVIHRSQRVFSSNYQTKNCLLVPLICQDRVVGVLNLADKRTGTCSSYEIALIELFGQLVGASIGNVKMFERMQCQATTDGLTGFVNHRTFYDMLERELRRSRRHGGTISMVMIDVDDLKRVNDTYGHRAGDSVIREVSTRLRNCIRKIDIPARYGGDEFAVILPNTSIDDASVVARRMVQTVSGTPVLWNEHQIPLSVSVGVGQYDANSTPEDVTSQSDRALYVAKHAGKNRVEVVDL